MGSPGTRLSWKKPKRRADVIACARYEMTTLYQQLADEGILLEDTPQGVRWKRA